ncbi:hypothetical protein Hypma_013572 [Hypsizygus marmoreus]|uniref:Uncharacterized protein n=1 Tax=Hypsizygus marmoreus TaxID=39966 RepID=A0A369JDF4_HYPMA|nr:hypothetical protein Hypma_013572 [Hypsizygus marmoreus]
MTTRSLDGHGRAFMHSSPTTYPAQTTPTPPTTARHASPPSTSPRTRPQGTGDRSLCPRTRFLPSAQHSTPTTRNRHQHIQHHHAQRIRLARGTMVTGRARTWEEKDKGRKGGLGTIRRKGDHRRIAAVKRPDDNERRVRSLSSTHTSCAGPHDSRGRNLETTCHNRLPRRPTAYQRQYGRVRAPAPTSARLNANELNDNSPLRLPARTTCTKINEVVRRERYARLVPFPCTYSL